MGAATDRKVAEIEQTRRSLEGDLRELQAHIPAPLRSIKSLVGLIVGSGALTLFVLERLRGKRSAGHPVQEVVVRIVRDDL